MKLSHFRTVITNYRRALPWPASFGPRPHPVYGCSLRGAFSDLRREVQATSPAANRTARVRRALTELQLAAEADFNATF